MCTYLPCPFYWDPTRPCPRSEPPDAPGDPSHCSGHTASLSPVLSALPPSLWCPPCWRIGQYLKQSSVTGPIWKRNHVNIYGKDKYFSNIAALRKDKPVVTVAIFTRRWSISQVLYTKNDKNLRFKWYTENSSINVHCHRGTVSIPVQIKVKRLERFQFLLLRTQWKYVDQCNVKALLNSLKFLETFLFAKCICNHQMTSRTSQFFWNAVFTMLPTWGTPKFLTYSWTVPQCI